MPTVADFADQFAKRARAGEKPSVYVSKAHTEPHHRDDLLLDSGRSRSGSSHRGGRRGPGRRSGWSGSWRGNGIRSGLHRRDADRETERRRSPALGSLRN
jgi:hypothetical protein